MTEFIITVLCAAHLHSCPIPNGYHGKYKAVNKEQCEQKVRVGIAGFGYQISDFRISCREK